ncbi:MAG: hypothetical protein RM338_22865 [Nostoc sp. DedQUE12a]|nr:hypothetical protein [Nostoc sp. DedQUE12a]
MIVDVPTGDDFKAAGIDFLNLAWDIIISLLIKLKEAQDFYEEYYADEDENEEISNYYNLPSDEYWKKAQRHLSTALSLTQQGSEFLLKGHIATVSPYLLLSGDPNNYPSKSHERDVRFSEFKTIDAQDLIRAYNTVVSCRLPEDFKNKFEHIRSKRNTIMHTVDLNLSIEITNLFIEILEISHYLISPHSWIKYRKDFIEKEPDSVLYQQAELTEYNKIIYILSREVNLLIGILKPAETRKYFNFDKKQRRYICPYCYDCAFRKTYLEEGSYEMPRLAQLLPNESASTSVYCLVCSQTSEVLREDCSNNNCRGNVIDEGYGICLTCGEELED